MFQKQGYEKLQQNRLLLSLYRITIGVEHQRTRNKKRLYQKCKNTQFVYLSVALYLEA